MKHFKLISAIFVALIALIFATNVIYMVRLYGSIRANVERDVANAIADMDIDDMWERAERYKKIMIMALQTSGNERADSLLNERESYSISGVMNDDGEFETRTVKGTKTEEVRRSGPLDRDKSFSNQLAAEMSQQMHLQMDGRIDFNLAVTDSILLARLADRHIYPENAAVEIVDSLGKVINGNVHAPSDSRGYDVFMHGFNPAAGMYYRIYVSSLTRHILSEMAGVIVSSVLLIIVFGAAFIYLYRTVARLRTIEEMKDDFTNNMTHELKTPIAIAYAANDALLNYDATNDPDKKASYLKVALQQLTRLSELVESILSMSMERRKSLPLKMERVDIVQFAEDIAAQHRLRADKSVTINVYSSSAEVTVTADRSHLANVINNIIDNSIKYSSADPHICIRISDRSIMFADNGIGIPAKCLPYVFNKFYRVPHGDRQDARGYGIGLYYVRNIVERFGWTISVSSRPGEGTEFTIKF